MAESDVASLSKDELQRRLLVDKKDIASWVRLLRLEYLEIKSLGDCAALKKLIPKFSAAFASVGSGDIRKSQLFLDLQADEARVVMQCDVSKARTLLKTAKASPTQKNNWSLWRLIAIHEARTGGDADSVRKLLESCRAQFGETSEWSRMFAAACSDGVEQIAAADIDADITMSEYGTHTPTSLSVEIGGAGAELGVSMVGTRCEGVEEGDTVCFKLPSSSLSSKQTNYCAPAPATVQPTVVPSSATLRESIAKAEAIKPSSTVSDENAVERLPVRSDNSSHATTTATTVTAVPNTSSKEMPTAESIRKSLTRKFGTALRVGAPAPASEPVMEAAPSADAEDDNAPAVRVPAPRSRSIMSVLSTSSDKGAGAAPAKATASVPPPVPTAPAATPQQSIALAKRRRTTLLKPAFISNLSPVVEKEDKTPAASKGDTSSAMSSLSSSSSDASDRTRHHTTRSQAHNNGDTAAIMASIATPHDFSTMHPSLDATSTMHNATAALSFSQATHTGDINLNTSTIEMIASTTTTSGQRSTSQKMTFEVPDYIKNFGAANKVRPGAARLPSAPVGPAKQVSTAPLHTPVQKPAVASTPDDDEDDDDDVLISPIAPRHQGVNASQVGTGISPDATVVLQPKAKSTSDFKHHPVISSCSPTVQEMDSGPTIFMGPVAHVPPAAPHKDIDSSFDDSDDDVIVFNRKPEPPAQPEVRTSAVSARGPAPVRSHSESGSMIHGAAIGRPSFFSGDARETVSVGGRQYLKLDCIGKGGSSRVYRVLADDMSVFALKRVRLSRMDQASIASYTNEIALMKKLAGRRHIIKLIDAEISYESKCIHMVMEYGQCDLNKMLQDERGHGGKEHALDPNVLRLVWQQMLTAVQTIHDARIVHGDLKPANFVFVEGVLKLIDFGIAKAISNDTTNIVRDGQVGTVNYMSPEAIQDGSGSHTVSAKGAPILKLGRASDIWSLGCILYQMVYGKTPFADLPLIPKLQAICDARYDIKFPLIEDSSLIDVMQRCLMREASKRPPIAGAHGLLNHPFLKPCSAAPPSGMPADVVKSMVHVMMAQLEAAGHCPMGVVAKIDSAVNKWVDAFHDKSAGEQLASFAQLMKEATAPAVTLHAKPAMNPAMAALNAAIRGREPRASAHASPIMKATARQSPKVSRSISQPPRVALAGAQLQEEILKKRAALKPVSFTAEDKENALPMVKGKPAASTGLEAMLRKGLQERFGQLASPDNTMNTSMDLESTWMPC